MSIQVASGPVCRATVDNHCCWIPGAGVCPHFDATLPDGFCSLRAELGSWDAVHEDERYVPQRKAFEDAGTPLCGNYPRQDHPCGTCGAVGK